MEGGPAAGEDAAEDIQAATQICLDSARLVAHLFPHMTIDYIAALKLYSADSPLYGLLNKVWREYYTCY